MDTLTKAIVLTTILSVATLGLIVILVVNDINQVNIPDIEQGTILSKQALSGQTDYLINLQGGKTLCIQNNATLYDNLVENQTYIFNCRIDLINHITIVDTIIPKEMP